MEDDPSAFALGVPAVDAALGGGLPRGALHEVAAAGEAEFAAATGFVLALAARAVRGRALLWVAEDATLAESGAPYGPGLVEAGLAPEQVLAVAAARPRDGLWALEEALRCRAVGAVIGEFRRAHAVDAVAARRLALAARERQAFALLLRARPDPRPLAAATRWVVGAAPSAPAPRSTGPPLLAVELTRNRHGRTGSWLLEWNRAEQHFDLAAHPQPVAAPPADGPRRAAGNA